MKKMFFAVAAVILSSQLQAQPKKDSIITTSDEFSAIQKSLDPVVVSATKYPMKTSKTGKVLLVITKEQLDKSGGKDLAQILTEQTGIYINGANSNPGKDKSIYLRGARVDHTLITIDGVPVYDPSGIGGNFDIRNMAVSNIERIEILKGSQSTLYGSDAIAGVINIITKKASNKTISGNALLSYGSFNTLRTSAGVNGKSGIVDYNLNYNYLHSKGINEASSTAPIADKDGYTQNSVQFGLGIQPTKNIRIQPFLRYTKLDGDLDQGAFTDELDYTYQQKSVQAGVKNEFGFGNAKLNIIYNYNTINRSYTDDSVKSRNGYDIYSHGSYKGNEHFADAYINVPLVNDIKVTAGADFRSSQSDQNYLSVSSFGPFTSSYSKDSLHQRQLGLYASANYQKNYFTVEAGTRLNVHNEYGSNVVYNFNPSYLVNGRVKIFSNLSSGFRTPSLYQLYSEYGNRKLNPEKAQTFEAGLQYFSNNNKWNSRVVYFRRNVKEVIFFYFNPVTFQSQYINQDKQKDHGLELELAATLGKINLKAFYTYVTGEISTKNASGKDTTFFNLLRRPKNSFGLNISSQLTQQVFVSSNLSAFGERKDAYFDNNTFQTVQTTLKSYVLWDVYGEYHFIKTRLRVFADLRNITGSKYTEVSGFNTTGFAAYGGIRYQF